jgi:hypothetical protein
MMVGLLDMIQFLYYFVGIFTFIPVTTFLTSKFNAIKNKIFNNCDNPPGETDDTDKEDYNLLENSAPYADKLKEEERLLKKLQKNTTLQDSPKFHAIFTETLDKNIIYKLSNFFLNLKKDDNHVYIILHVSSGGSVGDCAIIMNILLSYLKENPKNRLTMCVPMLAVSSGTQLLLCGTNLIMGKYAHLSPIDDQISEIGVKHLARFLKQKKCKKQRFTLSEYDTILSGEYLYNITCNELNNILHHCDAKTLQNVKKLFLDHKLYHSYPIDITMARSTGLKINQLDDALVIKIFEKLYQLWM